MKQYTVLAGRKDHPGWGWDAQYGPFQSRAEAERTITAIAPKYTYISIEETEVEEVD